MEYIDETYNKEKEDGIGFDPSSIITMWILVGRLKYSATSTGKKLSFCVYKCNKFYNLKKIFAMLFFPNRKLINII